MNEMLDGPILKGKISTKPLPEIYPHKSLGEIAVEAARKVVEKLHEEFLQAQLELGQMKLDAKMTKTPLPDNYWKKEHLAELRYKAAVEILNITLEEHAIL